MARKFGARARAAFYKENLVVRVWLSALTVLWILVAIGLSANQTQLQSNVKNQVENRAANVRTWCGAITGLEGALQAYVKAVHAPALSIPPLDCAAIVAKTLASTR